MKIAVASGKGGTGKTTVAVNLATVASCISPVAYIDCDVEAPNGHLFLKPDITGDRPATVRYPVIDASLCNGCRECVSFCRFNALIMLDGSPLVFPELCHDCGGCEYVCSSGAVSFESREIGRIRTGTVSDSIRFASGELTIGQPISPPLIKAAKNTLPPEEITFFDSPPGTSCPVIETIRDADYVVLVTEPTPFGLHDLTCAIDMVQALGISCGVVINRSDIGTNDVRQYCRENGINVLAEIPDDRHIAEAYARGEIIVEKIPGSRELYAHLLASIIQENMT